jgi:hypothetical protein
MVTVYVVVSSGAAVVLAARGLASPVVGDHTYSAPPEALMFVLSPMQMVVFSETSDSTTLNVTVMLTVSVSHALKSTR